MVRSYNTLACFLLGMALILFVHSGLELYVFVILAFAIPWELLAVMTGDLIDEYSRWRREEKDQAKLDAALVRSGQTD